MPIRPDNLATPFLLFAFALFIAWLDYVTGPIQKFGFFYQIPTIIACVRYGVPGLLMVPVAGVLYTLNNLAFPEVNHLDLIPFNLGVRYISFLTIGLVSVGLHHALKEARGAQSRLAVSLSEKQALLDCLPDAVIRMDLDGVVCELGGRCRVLLGLDEGSVGRRVDALEVDPNLASFFQRFLSTPAAAAGRVAISHPRHRSVLALTAPVSRVEAPLHGYVVVFRDITELVETHEQLVARARSLAVQETRTRIAFHLHDGLAQTMASLRMRLEIASEEMETDVAAARKTLARTIEISSEAIRGVRQMMYELRHIALDRLPLVQAIESHLRDINAASGLLVAYHGPNKVTLDAEYEVLLFLIVQEALANVVKHSGAQRVDVTLDADDNRLQVKVKDDGQGFDVSAAHHDLRSYGLRDMQQRATTLGGSFRVDSRPGAGAEVTLNVPIRHLENVLG